MISAFREDFTLTLEDLSEAPLAPRTIVEGLGLLPEALMPYLEDRKNAVWLVPSVELHRELLNRRVNEASRKRDADASKMREHLTLVFFEPARTPGAMAATHGARVIKVDTMDELRQVPDLLAEVWDLKPARS